MKVLLPHHFGDGPSRSPSCFKFLILTLVLLGFILLFISITRDSENLATPEKIKSSGKYEGHQIFKAFTDCVLPKLNPYRGNHDLFWSAFVNKTSECDNLKEYESLTIRPVANKDEVKFIILPNKETNITMVTLGIGHDVSGEITLKQIWPKTEFFGADPSSDINKDLYEKELGGKYFQYAVGGQNGMQEAFVLGKNEGDYRTKTVMHIGAEIFFRDEIKKQKIDILWMDIEGHEFPVMDMLHRDGPFDKKGVKICQINVEIHKDIDNGITGERQMFHDFVWKLMGDGRYVMVKPFSVWFYHDFIRTVLINVYDKECTDLYVK